MQPFPPSGDKITISTNGGNQPRWSADGKEIFYLGDQPNRELMAASVVERGDRTLKVGNRTVLFPTHANTFAYSYAVTANGQRFLIATDVPQDVPPATLTVILNWPTEAAALRR